MDFGGKFKEISLKAIARFAKELDVDKGDVQILLYLKKGSGEDENNYETAYRLMNNFRGVKELTFANILNVKMVLNPMMLVVPPFIKNSLVGYSKELECAEKDVFVFIVCSPDDVIYLWLYKSGEAVKKIELDDLFSNGA